MAQDALRGLRDVDGLIADALEIVVDARNGQHEAQVGGHQLMQRQQLHDAVVNFHLQFVDGRLFRQHVFGQRLFAIQHGMDGLVHGAFGQAAHPQQPFLQLAQINFKMSFHGSSPLTRSSCGLIRRDAANAGCLIRSGR